MKRDTGVSILTYHGLGEDSGQNGLYTLPRSQFEAQMGYLLEKKYQTVSLGAVKRYLEGAPLPEKSVVITFDDGLESDFSIAFPILKRYGFQATFFVNPGTVGHVGYLTAASLKKMSEAGMDIGSHGFDHIFLTRLDNLTLRHQLIDSKRILEEWIGKKISFFSIPRGRYTPQVLEAIQKGTYDLVCTSDIGCNRSQTDPFRLQRWAMKRSYRLDDFISVVEGRAKKHLVLEHVVKRSAYALLGHTLYENFRNRVLKEKK